ncbi:unnamed protein product [Linum tenue]|uniref:SNRNP25 ubiquitin-like domain-containing protein n=1 Tax=Linum tenue TaxID=586396 RepID=A0AAV0HBW8_9ROSI|nr:unnamed protein product [Linum tenue]
MEKVGSSSAQVAAVASEEEIGSYYHSSNVKKAKLQSTLSALLDDPVLADVPKNPSLSDVDTLISLELGSAMRVSVLKLDGTTLGNEKKNRIPPSSLWHFVEHLACNCHPNLCVSTLGERRRGGDELGNRKGFEGSDHEESDRNGAIENGSSPHFMKVKHLFSHSVCRRHVWANFALSHHNQKLTDDNSPLQEFGLRNNSQVNFVPYVAAKASGHHSKRKNHRFFHGLSRA